MNPEDLKKTATLGLSRRMWDMKAHLSDVKMQCQKLLQDDQPQPATDTPEPAEGFWREAGFQTYYRLGAGLSKPVTAPGAGPEPGAQQILPEERPVLPPEGVEIVEQIMRVARFRLIRNAAVEVVARRGYRLPVSWAHSLAGKAYQNKITRRYAVQALGTIGRAALQQHPTLGNLPGLPLPENRPLAHQSAARQIATAQWLAATDPRQLADQLLKQPGDWPQPQLMALLKLLPPEAINDRLAEQQLPLLSEKPRTLLLEKALQSPHCPELQDKLLEEWQQVVSTKRKSLGLQKSLEFSLPEDYSARLWHRLSNRMLPKSTAQEVALENYLLPLPAEALAARLGLSLDSFLKMLWKDPSGDLLTALMRSQHFRPEPAVLQWLLKHRLAGAFNADALDYLPVLREERFQVLAPLLVEQLKEPWSVPEQPAPEVLAFLAAYRVEWSPELAKAYLERVLMQYAPYGKFYPKYSDKTFEPLLRGCAASFPVGVELLDLMAEEPDVGYFSTKHVALLHLLTQLKATLVNE